MKIAESCDDCVFVRYDDDDKTDFLARSFSDSDLKYKLCLESIFLKIA